MKEKILKFNLALLFTLSLISLFYYFFAAKMPDNSFVITSHAESYYSFIYYISSFFAKIAYYVGPWIIAPFLCYAFVYNFILVTRNRVGDSILALTFSLFFLGLSFLLFPNGLGDGIKTVLERNFDVYTIFILNSTKIILV